MISLPTIISNYIQFNFWGIAMNILLTRRYSRLKTFLLFQLIILGMIFFPYILLYLSIWRAMIGLITWAAPLVLYSDKIRKKLVVFALCTVTTMFVELWVAVLLPPEVVAAGVSAQTTELQCGIYAVYDASTALLLAVGTLFLKRFDLKNEQYLTLRHWLGFSLFPISQYVLLCGWFSELALEDFSLSKLIFMVIAELICMVSDAVLYMSMVSIARRSRLAAENELLKKQIDAQKAHYAALTDQYEDIRRMRHDIANHMYTINLLLKDGRTEEAAAYAKGLAHIRVRGLMTIPPVAVEKGGNIPYFEKVHRLFVDISREMYDNKWEYISMGMSGDYADAVRCGANMVRVGSAIFGARNYQK